MSWNYHQPKKNPDSIILTTVAASNLLEGPSRGLSILEKVVVYTASLANRYSGKIMLTNTSLNFFFFNFNEKVIFSFYL